MRSSPSTNDALNVNSFGSVPEMRLMSVLRSTRKKIQNP